MDNTSRGRLALQAWQKAKPTNLFTSDTNLQHILRRYLGQDRYTRAEAGLDDLGAQAATILDYAAQIEDRPGNHPQLERYTGIGERTEAIAFHPHHDLAGRIIWNSGIMSLQREPGHSVEQMALFYLLAHNGENGHLCALTCTAGLIRALQYAADEATCARFLPPLLESDYATMQHGAQFLTEIQGGSDVGANTVTAIDAGDGTWRIRGEKWFCSNINADQFLLTARPQGAPDGTRGLGLFIVPRHLDDGRTNGFYLRRLKDKLGTRTLASAEVDFQDALAYPLGPLDRGFKNVVELVLNTSRLMNAVACAGIMRRAYLEAAHYACSREAFGQPIASYPLVQEAIADMLSEMYAALASSFYIAHLVDRIDTQAASEAEQNTYRLLVNLNKYITSIRASEIVHRAIEVLGGNGAIETFSILPRLYRDMVVLESWEGTHNVLCLQALRDIARYRMDIGFDETMMTLLNGVTHTDLAEPAASTRKALATAWKILKQMNIAGDHYAQAHARRLADLLAHTAQATLLLAEAQWELENGLPTIKLDATIYFVNRHLQPGYDPLADDTYLPRLEKLMSAL